MPLTINTNMAASRASYFLSKNNDALQKSLDRLSSGRKITQPADVIPERVERPGDVTEVIHGRQHRETLGHGLALDVPDDLPRDIRPF